MTHPAIRPHLDRHQVAEIMRELDEMTREAKHRGDLPTANALQDVTNLVITHWTLAEMRADATALALTDEEITPADVIGGDHDPHD